MYEIKRDTAVFGLRQWYIEDIPGPMFTTREDAEAALVVGVGFEERERTRIWESIDAIF